MSRIFAVVIAVAIVLIAYDQYYSEVTIDGRAWNVVGSYDNNKEAAALMARVNARLIEFFRLLKIKYHINETADQIAEEGHLHTSSISPPDDVRNMIGNMIENYNPDEFYENNPKYSTETSYTIRKGEAMYICLRNKKNPAQLVDEHILLFTMLHEVAHIANYRGWGHQPDFWQVFKFLLREAAAMGIYRPVDYKKDPVEFCGLHVDYNPYFDEGIRNIGGI